MTQQPMVSPHDGLGSNLFGHVLRGKLMRVVPRQNDAINETWISDRDRFSYEGVYSADRLTAPMVREHGEWKQVDWQTALNAVAAGIKAAPRDSLGFLASPSSTVEEFTLLSRMASGLSCANIDHRLRQSDFSGDAEDAFQPSLGLSIAAVDELQALLVVGSNLRHEIPLLANRVRKAAVQAGAKVSFINPARYEYLFPVASYSVASPAEQLTELAALVAAATDATAPAGVTIEQRHRDVVASLKSAERKAIWLGALAVRHPAYASLRSLAAALAAATGASLGVLAEGANAAGAYLAGVLPGRVVGGAASAAVGLSARAMLEKSLHSYVLMGVEPVADSLVPGAAAALAGAQFVVALTPYASEELKACAHVLLPIGSFAESSGTYVNLEGEWQSFPGVAQPVGESRPAWKVLRVLGNLLGLQGFEQQSSEDVRADLRALLEATAGQSAIAASSPRVVPVAADARVVDVPMYQIDAVLRRATSLQATRDAQAAVVQGAA